MSKVIGVVMAVIATLFVAGLTGGLLLSAIHFGFSTIVVTMLSVCFAVITLGVGTVSVMDALDLV